MSRENEDLMKWLAFGERGISSETMVQHLTGVTCLRRSDMSHPHDPADLGRCRKLLEQAPSLTPKFSAMASLSGSWAELVKCWDELCSTMDKEAPEWRRGTGQAPQTYARMKTAIEAGCLADKLAKRVRGGA